MADIEFEKTDNILKDINTALKGKKLYPAGHPAITAPVTKAFQTLSEVLKTNNKIFIGMVKDVMVFEDNPIMDADKNLGEFLHTLKQREIEGIIFEKGLMQKEFLNFIDILSGDDVLKGKELQNTLAAKSVMHISVKSILKRNILEAYNDAVSAVKETMHEIRMGRIPQSKEIIRVTDQMKDNKSDLHIIGIAALLHDIGKTGVAEDIIRKPGSLSNTEWETVKQHPVLGSRIIERMDDIAKLVGRLIYEHHIRYDRSGYPYTESAPHQFSMLITIADAYDAL